MISSNGDRVACKTSCHDLSELVREARVYMSQYASLQSSIRSAVESYESYKGQSLRLKLENVSLGTPEPTTVKSHAKRSSIAKPIFSRADSSDAKNRPPNLRLNSSASDSLPSPRLDSPSYRSGSNDRRPSSPSHRQTSRTSEFENFIVVAESYEASNFLFDLDFLMVVLDFLRSEHPYTSNSLQKSIKARNNGKKKLWTQYTTEMQGLARAYTSGKPSPVPSATSPLSPVSAKSSAMAIRERRRDLTDLISKLESSERTCAESLLSAISHLHSQAVKDIHARYSMPDPINDKVTPVHKHNERVRVFNQLIKFVCEDLRRVEMLMKSSGHVQNAEKKKDKKGSGVVEAVESLCVEDYPPYGSK